MNRRKFLELFGLAAGAAVIPLNRVWSFPSKIVIPQRKLLTTEQVRDRAIVDLAYQQGYQKAYFVNKNGLYEVVDGNVQLINVSIAQELYERALCEMREEAARDFNKFIALNPTIEKFKLPQYQLVNEAIFTEEDENV